MEDVFLELSDDTVIVDSEVTFIGSAKLHVRKTMKDGKVKNALCELPGYKWETEDEFSDEEKDMIIALIKDKELLIYSGMIL